ncbi:MAG: V-type ATP synthase subunit E [Candidatus Thermoplasmatota archaeon]|nr:V-type ATP synthase subunit E [Candidatus Thermoplasmatota archaeon]
MSVEKIIEQINLDTQKEINQILKEADIQANKIIKDSVTKSEIQSKEIILNGEKKSDSIKQIIISKENQNAKKTVTITREEIIESCFEKAHHKLKQLNVKDYEKLVNKFIREGIKKIGDESSIKISNDIDKKIAKKFGLKIIGKTDSIGGVIIISKDGKITLDNTIEGIIKREKDRIRIKIGKILFS